MAETTCGDRTTKINIRPPSWSRSGLLLKNLSNRNERLIDLGIAQYGSNAEIIHKIWVSGDKPIRHAIASNKLVDLASTSILLKPRINSEILSGSDTELQRVYIQNPSLDAGMLATIINPSIGSKNEDQRIQFAVYAIQRPDLQSEAPSGVFKEDPYNEQKAELPFSAIYRLLINIKPSFSASALLCDEIGKLGRWVLPAEELQSDSDPEPVDKAFWGTWYEGRQLLALKRMLEKWILPEVEADAKHDFDVRFRNATYYHMRLGIASLVPISKTNLRNYISGHSDEAIRSGYYRSENYASIRNVQAGFDRDGFAFLDAVIPNKYLYMRTNEVVSDFLDRLIDFSFTDWERQARFRRWRYDLRARYFSEDPETYLPPK